MLNSSAAKRAVVIASAAAALGPFASVHAGPISSATWYEFGWNYSGLATGCTPADPGGIGCQPSSGTPSTFADAPPWTFTAPAGGAIFTVTDAFQMQDLFSVLDFGAFIGTTSTPAFTLTGCGDDPVPCLANPDASHGSFALGAGLHSITIDPLDGNNGAGYFRWDPVPEPGSLALLGAAGVALLLARRRKYARVA